jgi:hypothetical protein
MGDHLQVLSLGSHCIVHFVLPRTLMRKVIGSTLIDWASELGKCTLVIAIFRLITLPCNIMLAPLVRKCWLLFMIIVRRFHHPEIAVWIVGVLLLWLNGCLSCSSDDDFVHNK